MLSVSWGPNRAWAPGHGSTPASQCHGNRAVSEQSTFQVRGERLPTSQNFPRVKGRQQRETNAFQGSTQNSSQSHQGKLTDGALAEILKPNADKQKQCFRTISWLWRNGQLIHNSNPWLEGKCWGRAAQDHMGSDNCTAGVQVTQQRLSATWRRGLVHGRICF